MEIKRLDWDSDFFGLRIGRVDIATAEECVALACQQEALEGNYDLVYVFASHGLDVSLPNVKLVDEKVVYMLPLPYYSEPNRNVRLWSQAMGVTDELLHLALVSGTYSRFKLDERFPSGSYERLYSRWIENSIKHILATEVFCYMEDRLPKGLVTLNDKNGVATIGLVSIHEDFQHRGIGTIMMHHVSHFAQGKGCKKLMVATQLKNTPACWFYEKNGFSVESITDIWHWWL